MTEPTESGFAAHEVVPLRAPFPYFGGKSRVADLVWSRLGDVPNYVEPFFGSGAVLLARPHAPRIETVNDLNGFVANFWRAVAVDPDAVAAHADWPVSELDLHARHRWLVDQGPDLAARLRADPAVFDAQVAGWWVWGLCQWIGGGWCAGAERDQDERRPSLSWPNGVLKRAIRQPRPLLGGTGGGKGVHAKRPVLGRGQRGLKAQLPELSAHHGRGLYQRSPNVYRGGRGVIGLSRREELAAAMRLLQERLRHVRVCCGDWSRVTGPTPTHLIGLSGVFLDPPYARDLRDDRIYASDPDGVARAAAAWAFAQGDNPKLRIALCGLDGEHAPPPTWTTVAWRKSGGYAYQSRAATGRGRANAAREVVHFSPHCLRPQSHVQAALGLDAE